MSMMEKLLNRIRQKIVVDDYDEETLSHDEDADHEKMMKHFHMTEKMTKLNRRKNYMFCMS